MTNTVENILTYRLPNRLEELKTFIMLASALEDHATSSVELKIGSETYSIDKARLLLNVLADGAAVIARTLLQFMGLSLQKSSSHTTLVQMNWRPDDVKITDLTLAAVTPQQATDGWPQGEQRAEQLLKLCFATADKVSAHFTTKTATMQNATISELSIAFTLVIDLVNREIYDRLNMPCVISMER